jgi:hypothetical protein
MADNVWQALPAAGSPGARATLAGPATNCLFTIARIGSSESSTWHQSDHTSRLRVPGRITISGSHTGSGAHQHTTRTVEKKPHTGRGRFRYIAACAER